MGTAYLEKQASGRVSPPLASRIRGLDTLRGVCVVLMVLFHLGYDLYAYCGLSFFTPGRPLMAAVQAVASWGFLLLAGVSATLSRSNVRRGLRLVLCGAVVSLVTAPWGDPIRFGVLALLGWSMVLYGLTAPLWTRLPPAAGTVLPLLLFAAARTLFPRPVSLPFLYPFGLYAPGFQSADYWPLLPWFFLFLAGTGLGRFRDRFPEGFRSFRLPGLDWLGRHSLPVYLLHQPVLVGLVMGAARLTGHPFAV